MSFIIFKNEKTPFQAIKTRSSKSRKIDIFLNGLTHAFGPKMAIFPTFFFLGNIRQENVFYDILERENASLGYKHEKFKKSKNRYFSIGLTDGFGSKMAIFYIFFFQAIQARKMSFMIFLHDKKSFQGIKTRSSKSLKTDIFSKELTHCFGPKMAIFLTFFFQAIQTRKMSSIIFQNDKTPFQAKKTRSSKSRIIGIFPQG